MTGSKYSSRHLKFSEWHRVCGPADNKCMARARRDETTDGASCLYTGGRRCRPATRSRKVDSDVSSRVQAAVLVCYRVFGPVTAGLLAAESPSNSSQPLPLQSGGFVSIAEELKEVSKLLNSASPARLCRRTAAAPSKRRGKNVTVPRRRACRKPRPRRTSRSSTTTTSSTCAIPATTTGTWART